jgi:hypothetical protein
MDPHPLFREFIRASLNYGKKKRGSKKKRGLRTIKKNAEGIEPST